MIGNPSPVAARTASYTSTMKRPAAFGITAPVVVARVGMRRAELRDQVAVAAMDVDAVETGRGGPTGSRPERLHEPP